MKNFAPIFLSIALVILAPLQAFADKNSEAESTIADSAQKGVDLEAKAIEAEKSDNLKVACDSYRAASEEWQKVTEAANSLVGQEGYDSTQMAADTKAYDDRAKANAAKVLDICGNL